LSLAALHKRVTGRHRRCFVAECVVQERARFVDAKRRTLRLCDQRVYISRAKRGLCLRPKCLICGDDILASSARCRLTACLYSFNVTRSLNKATICLKKSFTCVFQRLFELLPPEATELCCPVPIVRRIASYLRHRREGVELPQNWSGWNGHP